MDKKPLEFTFDDLPPMIGPIKKTNSHLNFMVDDTIDQLGIREFADFYLDYDGFYTLLELNDFKFSNYLEEDQHDQIDLLAQYFNHKKEYDKSIKLITCKYDWFINIHSSNENYEQCAITLEGKKRFLSGLDKINNDFNTSYGK